MISYIMIIVGIIITLGGVANWMVTHSVVKTITTEQTKIVNGKGQLVAYNINPAIFEKFELVEKE